MIHCQRCGGETNELERDGRFRPVCVPCGFVTYWDPKLAAAVIIERDGRLLLAKRGDGGAEPGKWSFPAGFVERGERVEDAAVREVQEETGLDVSVTSLLGLYSEMGETVVLAVYLGRLETGQPKPSDDVVDVGWFAPDDLPRLAFEHDQQIVADWLAIRKRPGELGVI